MSRYSYNNIASEASKASKVIEWTKVEFLEKLNLAVM